MKAIAINRIKNNLTSEELIRYDRQLKILGLENQKKLKKSKVAIIGVGGLGSPVLLYLTAAGVGFIKLIDFDRVSLSNLNRQIIHWTNDIGRDKVISAKEKLNKLNPNVMVVPVKQVLSKENSEILLKDVDLCIDALDNWKSKLLLNEICVKLRKPLIHAGVKEFYGQMLVIIPGKTPCLRCIISEEPMEKKNKIPVIGVTPGILGLLQALEAIKLITGIGELSLNKLVIFDGLSLELTKVGVDKNPNCPICSRI